MYSIGIDIGGMSIKVGLVDENGKILKENRAKTEKTYIKCIDNMVKQIEDLLNEFNITAKDLLGIGIGCPGATSTDKGVVDILPNLGWDKVPLVKLLKKHFDTKIIISNDANVAILAENLYGCAKNYDNCVMFTLGTGVGGGIIINKKLYEGGHGRGTELGHMTLFMNGKPCTCGRNGCVERYVSATALIEQTKEEMLKNKKSSMWEFVGGDIDKVDGRTAFECSKNGDESAIKVRDNYVAYLSESILNMLNIFRPDVFILGGGVSAQKKYLSDLVEDYIKKFNYGYVYAPKTKIVTAKLGNEAGIIGAAALLK